MPAAEAGLGWAGLGLAGIHVSNLCFRILQDPRSFDDFFSCKTEVVIFNWYFEVMCVLWLSQRNWVQMIQFYSLPEDLVSIHGRKTSSSERTTQPPHPSSWPGEEVPRANEGAGGGGQQEAEIGGSRRWWSGGGSVVFSVWQSNLIEPFAFCPHPMESELFIYLCLAEPQKI